MKRYNPQELEPKWQKIWEESKIYSANLGSQKPKYIGFGMFNYPSGAGIHVGHVRNYTIPDVITRFKRQQGFEAYQPVGWDSFGLPAENFAIKTGVSPQESTSKAIEKYQRQYRAMGWAVDWDKEINTTDPGYYKWTQWAFLKLFENDLAYQKESPQWWCPHDKTVLADEQVENGRCWRCGHVVERRNLKQWFFKITRYADEILEATDELDWTPAVKASQKAWIGRSEGIIYTNKVRDTDLKIESFSAHFEAFTANTFVAIAPDHPFLPTLLEGIAKKDEILDLAKKMALKRDLEGPEGLEKLEGIFTERYAIDIFGDEDLPIWITNYALADYGTGIVLCSAHDERDFAFAKKYGIRLKPTMLPIDPAEAEKVKNLEYCFTDMKNGVLTEPEQFKGKVAASNRQEIVRFLQHEGYARAEVKYKIRDWLISRQRYWGAPIPIIHCPKCGAVPVPEKDLPVLLPEIKKYQPTGGNVSVLAGVEDWVNVDCPKCGGKAKRETDTMDGYVCSSWYFLRYLSPHDDKQAWSMELAQKWLPVDFYNGADHATAHLLYARFFTRFFHGLGLVGTPEPFAKMVYNGKVKAADGSAFSKSKGNGVDPLEIIESGYGADALRIYEMFAAPVELDVLWDPQGVPGSYRFLSRVWTLVHEFLEAKSGENSISSTQLLRVSQKTAKKVTEHIEAGKFNTAISFLMELTNELYKIKAFEDIFESEGWREALQTLIQLLAPFAPHITEELWQELGNNTSVHISGWPAWDEDLIKDEMITLAVQINGKVRSEIIVEADISEAEAIEAAKDDAKVAEYLKGKTVKKQIYIPGRLVSLVI
ncbi:MAG TPA: leucine--tRNA ligase [Candidatus Binatia bacterium]|nr:leucine--tRNA ligase [Candidatus Binatia bacterium]